MTRIRIVDDHYRFLCEVNDGKMLKVWKPGREADSIVKPCRYLDEYHFQFGNRTFHICQFGEWLKREGYQAETVGYFMDYRKHPQERFFGRDYYCLDKCAKAAFYYNPKEEYPFLLCPLNETGGGRNGIPQIGVSLMETIGYDVSGGKWELDFDIEKIKNIVYFNLPQTVMDTDKAELALQIDCWEKITTAFYKEYALEETTTYEEIQFMDKVCELETLKPPLLIEEELKSNHLGLTRDTHKVFAKKDFRHCDFSGIDLRGYTFIRCEFEGCTLQPENMKHAELVDCNLPGDFFRESGREKNGEKSR